MPRVFVLSGPSVGRSYDLGDGAVLGRGEECEAVLAEASVSRRHARLSRQGERWVVEDLGSRNGLLVDGQRVERVELNDGDQFALGKVALRIRVDPAESAPAAAPRSGDRLRFVGAAETLPLDAPPITREARRKALVEDLRAEPRGALGALGSDLEQRPFAVRLLIAVLAIALALIAMVGAFQLVQYLRGG